MIACGRQSFPSQTLWGTPYLQARYGWKNFFHALIARSVPTSLVHSSSVHSWKVPRTCKASWDFQQCSRGTQSLTEFDVQQSVHRQRSVIRGKRSQPFKIASCSELQYTHIFKLLRSFYETITEKTLDTEPQKRNSSLTFSCSNSSPNYSSSFYISLNFTTEIGMELGGNILA